MSGSNLHQVYLANPVTTIGATDLFYIDVGGTTDGAINGSSLLALFPSSTLTSGKIYVGNASNVATAQTVSGDASLSNAGALTVSKIGGVSISLAGALTTVGAFNSTLTFTNTTSITFPTSGTLATTSQLPSAAALTAGNDTNVTLTLGGTPATALLQGVSITAGWTGQLGVTRGGTGVSSVTISPTASSWAGWDANSNLSANNHLDGYVTTATAAGTTTLTVSSPRQQYFTGTTTQIVVMPVTSTLVLGQSWVIVNNSTGIVTVQSSGANTIKAMAAGTSLIITCILTSGTTAASWNFSYSVNAGVTASPWTAGVGTGSAIGGDGTSTAAGNYALSYGSGSCAASAANAFAQGAGSMASGTRAIALGESCTATKADAVAISLISSATGIGAISISGSSASGSGSIGLYGGSASGTNAVATGFGSTASHTGSFVLNDSVAVVADSANYQFVSAFQGGYNFFVNTTSAVAIDTAFNLINKKGVADQSISLQTPSTGFTITIGAGVQTVLLNPAGTLATGTITMPASPINGQLVRVATSQTITSLTVNGNTGQTINGAPTTLVANTGFQYIYNLSLTTWFRFY